jgi:hypothetical protein
VEMAFHNFIPLEKPVAMTETCYKGNYYDENSGICFYMYYWERYGMLRQWK